MEEKFKYIEARENLKSEYYKWKMKVRLTGEERQDIDEIFAELQKAGDDLYNKLYK